MNDKYDDTEDLNAEHQITLFKASLAHIEDQLQGVTPGSTMEENLLERANSLRGYIEKTLQQMIEEETANKAAVDAALDAFDNTKTTGSPVKGNHKTFAEWQQVRRDNPHSYYSTMTQNQIAADRVALGDRFYG